MSVCSVYALFSDMAEAERIGRIAVDERLAACVNILGAIGSIYRWKGSIETASEVAAIFKTTQQQADSLTSRIVQLHSYELPCVVTWPVDRCFATYAEWVEHQVCDEVPPSR